MGRVFANSLRDPGSIPGWVIPKTLKIVLDTSLLNTQQYKVRIKSKVEQSKWLSSQEMDTATRVQILDETDSISYSTNTLGKGMNLIILPPAMGK